MNWQTTRRGACIVAATCLWAAGMAAQAAQAASIQGVFDRPAPRLREPGRASVIAIVRAGKRVVALGERGAVLLSDDEGLHWRQAEVPVSLTLTAAMFTTPNEGWAVGHGGVVLHTSDQGEHWSIQLDGRQVAGNALASAKERARAGSETSQRLLARAQQLIDDGPDKPLLDICFSSSTKGYVVGAYGLMLETSDGGRTWAYLGDRLDNPKSLHLNAVRCEEAAIVVAGEQGLLLRSTDGGASFTRMNSPYRGSFFGLAVESPASMTVAGLRGNAFHTSDAGATWQRLDLATQANVTVLSPQHDDRWLMVTQAGDVFLSADRGRSFQRSAVPQVPRASSALLVTDGTLLIGSPAGAFKVVPGAGQTPKVSQ